MNLKRVEDLKTYVMQRHSYLHPRKFDIIKIGARTYLYYVGHDGCLHRQVVFRGCLPTIEGVPKLREVLDKSIDEAIKKWNPENNVNN